MEQPQAMTGVGALVGAAVGLAVAPRTRGLAYLVSGALIGAAAGSLVQLHEDDRGSVDLEPPKWAAGALGLVGFDPLVGGV